MYRECCIDDECRLDILVSTDRWRLVIENKIDAIDQPSQLERYREWLDQTVCAEQKALLIYLTPHRRQRPRRNCVTYREVRDLLRSLLPKVKDPGAYNLIEATIENISQNIAM